MKTLFVKKSFLIAAAILIAAAVCLGLFAGFAAEKAAAVNPNMPVIVIDAGHGGIDNGVQGINSGTDEADINLAIARFLKGQFTGAGFNCVMTRTTEAGLYGSTEKGFKMRDMQKRKQIIEDSKADMVISIHQNFCPLPSKRGGTVFFNNDSAEGKALALSIQSELNAMESCEKPNEILKGDYYMLKCTSSPSVIVECGFLSNNKDDELLNTESHQRALAYAIFKGAVSYFSKKS